MSGQMDVSLQAFFRGQLVLGLAFGGIMVLVYLALGIDYALILGVFLAVWEIVPVIGPPIGFIPAAIVVAIDGMDAFPVNRVTQLLILFAVFNGLQWLKDNLVAPRYIGNVIGLHPVTIFIAIMIGARLDGMLGIIFALPAACAANVLFSNLVMNEGVSESMIADETGVSVESGSEIGTRTTVDAEDSRDDSVISG
jgi:predicted PurR-regulated permease PerM